MKPKTSEEYQRILLLLKLDSQRVYERVKYRAPEYLSDFSLKRTREHFKDIFKTRYDETTFKELMHCGNELIVGLDAFYHKIDTMKWYLNHTQDMLNKVEDKITVHLKELESLYQTLNLYIEVEMGLASE